MSDGGKTRIQIVNLSLSFGGIKALTDVSLEIRDKEILAIIGPNGAGKTALLNCINGFYKPQTGEVYYDGQRITRMRPDKVAKAGIARTFQNIELYTGQLSMSEPGNSLPGQTSWLLPVLKLWPGTLDMGCPRYLWRS